MSEAKAASVPKGRVRTANPGADKATSRAVAVVAGMTRGRVAKTAAIAAGAVKAAGVLTAVVVGGAAGATTVMARVR